MSCIKKYVIIKAYPIRESKTQLEGSETKDGIMKTHARIY